MFLKPRLFGGLYDNLVKFLTHLGEDEEAKREDEQREMISSPMNMSGWTATLLMLIPFQAGSFTFTSRGAIVGGRGGRCADASFLGHESISGHRHRYHPTTQRMISPLPAMISPSPSTSSSSSSKSIISSAFVDSHPTTTIVSAVLDFYFNLDQLYDKSIRIKCPFFRRRAADLIDNAATVVRFLLIRHKSLPGLSDLFLDNDDLSSSPLLSNFLPAAEVSENHNILLTSDHRGHTVSVSSSHHNLMDIVSSPPGCKPLGYHIKRHPDGTSLKTRYLSISDITRQIQKDWIGGTHGQEKGYYITGKLDSTIYQDDCLFTSPDPDMPVRGLRKYLNAASHLFDPKLSDASLLYISSEEHGGLKGYGVIEVTWRLGGVIQLPWHPTVEPWTGKTRYHLNEEHLIYLHEESWDISVWRAFLCTLYPEAKKWKIWKDGVVGTT